MTTCFHLLIEWSIPKATGYGSEISLSSFESRRLAKAASELPVERIALDNELCVAVADKYPVTYGQMLVARRCDVRAFCRWDGKFFKP
jgi:hypothetical protein